MSSVLCGSHLPALIPAFHATTGVVLEMGIGWSSTPLLHWLCEANKRKLLSLETDEKWFNNFTEYGNENHSLRLVKDWSCEKFGDTDWGLALIDHRPAKERANSAARLRYRAEIVMLHDSEPEIDRFYRYGRAYKHFKYVYQYDKVKPHTAILSNFIDVERLYESLR
jgi:hypothetical protein